MKIIKIEIRTNPSKLVTLLTDLVSLLVLHGKKLVWDRVGVSGS